MAEQQSTHGGRREGAGRKPKSPDERLNEVFAVRLTADEKQLLDSANARAWARDLLVRAAKRKAC